MVGRILIVAVLAFPADVASPDGVALPEQTRGDMTARLMVHVEDAGPQPGAALVRLTITVTGGPLLQVDAPRLADSLIAWEPQINEWCRLDSDRLTWTKSILLRQIKAGPAALPDVKVRFRAGPAAPWQEAEWVDVLKTARGAPAPESLPEVKSGLSWLVWIGVASAVVVLAATVWRLSKPRRLRRTLPPDQWALQTLLRMEQTADRSSAAYHTSLSDLIRRYLAERFGLPATQQTTAEFLETVHRTGRLPVVQQDLLRDFLERCDLAKFAPVGASLEECREATALARAFVEQSAGANAAGVAR